MRALAELRASGATVRRGDRAMTVIEVTIAMALTVACFGALLGIFDSFTGAAESYDQTIDAHAASRQAMAEVTQDVRAANPMNEPSSSAAAVTSIEVDLVDGTGSDTVRYSYDDLGGTLDRHVLSGPGGSITSSREVATGVVNQAEGLSTFRYFDADGTELLPGVATAADFANCTSRVRITLAIEPAPGRPPVVTETDVAIRILEGETPC